MQPITKIMRSNLPNIPALAIEFDPDSSLKHCCDIPITAAPPKPINGYMEDVMADF